VTNLLIDKHLLRATGLLLTGAVLACGHHAARLAPEATAPLPTAGLAGQSVAVLPLTLVAAEDSLHWNAALADRRATLARADSIIGTLLEARAPEVTWVRPAALRHAARRAPDLATDPDQMATAIMRGPKMNLIPDPLRGQLRTLAALAGVSQFVVMPAALIFMRPHGATAVAAKPGVGRAELTVVIGDVRTGSVQWRTVAKGEGDNPWTALTNAVKALTPGLP
jgi:hypothetical protein